MKTERSGTILSLQVCPAHRNEMVSVESPMFTKPSSPCHRMEEIRTGLLKEIAGKRGMLARVISGSKVRRGNTVTADRP